MSKTAWHSFALFSLVLLACVVRLIGPFRDVALGQTDAYSHLQFLKDWLAEGRLRHPYYPVVYYWIIGWPTRWFGWDPYWVIRFGGAFFGAGLVLSSYLLTRYVWNARAGLWAAYLIAAFPAFHWLQKTGVGAYPSQLGLLLLPLILLAWDALWRGRLVSLFLLLPSLLLIIASVPMMGIDLLSFLLLDLLVRIALDAESRRAGLILLAVCLLGVVAFLVSLSRLESEYIVSIVAAVASHSYTPDDSAVTILRHILISYFLPIRWLPGPFPVAMAALGVGATLIVVLRICGRQGTAARMIALWALFAWLQAVFGFAQFSLYWRAGWVLLIALALLGGWILSLIMERSRARLQVSAYSMAVFAGAISFVIPPAHQPHLSAAENDLVKVLRSLEPPTTELFGYGINEWFPYAKEPNHLKVWARAYTSFDRHQGDPVHAFLERSGWVTIQSIESPEIEVPLFEPVYNHLIILDDLDSVSLSYGLMEYVNPDQIMSFRSAYAVQLGNARWLRRQVETAQESGLWTVFRATLPEGLELVLLQPSMNKSGQNQ